MKYFTSDIHLGSSEIITTDNRPFKNIKTFNKHIIKNWNNQAKANDTIFVIGDLFDFHNQPGYNWENNFKIIKHIKANIILIIGNNEERIIQNCFSNDFYKFRDFCLKNGIKEVFNDLTINILETPFFLTHKAKNHSNEILTLFGHSHKAIGLYKSFGFNIGYDLNNFRLYSEYDISHLLYMKDKYWDKDENLKLL